MSTGKNHQNVTFYGSLTPIKCGKRRTRQSMSALEYTPKHTGDQPQKTCALDPISLFAHASMTSV